MTCQFAPDLLLLLCYRLSKNEIDKVADYRDIDQLSELKKGNVDSFKVMYQRYHKEVYRFCYSFTKSEADAEEITADVFVCIWKKRSVIDPTLSLQPLLFKITKDLTWNYLKKTARSKRLMAEYLQNYSEVTEDVASEIVYQEYLDTIDQAVRKLPEQQEKVFTLRYMKGKDLNQISNELAISKNTVKVHLAKSKRTILSYLSLKTEVGLVLLLLSMQMF